MVHLFPTNERQCREVAKLPPQKRVEAWSQAVKLAGGKVPSAKIVRQTVTQIKGEPKMKPEPKSERIVRPPGMETEYLIYSDPETYQLLEAYRQKIGAATKNGAIRRLLDEENRRNEPIQG